MYRLTSNLHWISITSLYTNSSAYCITLVRCRTHLLLAVPPLCSHRWCSCTNNASSSCFCLLCRPNAQMHIRRLWLWNSGALPLAATLQRSSRGYVLRATMFSAFVSHLPFHLSFHGDRLFVQVCAIRSMESFMNARSSPPHLWLGCDAIYKRALIMVVWRWVHVPTEVNCDIEFARSERVLAGSSHIIQHAAHRA